MEHCKHGLIKGTCSLCLGMAQESAKSGLPPWFWNFKEGDPRHKKIRFIRKREVK